jgi:UDP-N-acetylglucosamine--N-acetylmuramyl-(pentapeptide) pyrophosphoryl-undecaprenol N-acetylglucosamine transferase
LNGCILFHAVNGIGLGHLSRLSAIALAVRDQDANFPLLFVVEGDSHGLLESTDLPFVAFPPDSRFEGDPNSWLRSIRGPLLGSIARSIVASTNPQLIVFDCFPNPAFLAAAKRKSIPFALCIRKFKDMNQYFARLRAVLVKARVIIFPHNSSELEVPTELIEKSHLVGTIFKPLTKTPALASQGHRPQIIVSGGGGGYPGTFAFYNFALEAISKCQETDPTLGATLVTGPLFHEWNELHPISGVQIIPFDTEITTRFREASLVICQGGYNTVAELTALGVPVICVPANRTFDDQYDRARKSAAAFSQFYFWEGSDSGALAAQIVRILQTPRTSTANTDDYYSDGAARAAEALIACMQTSKTP